jgi:hypothetical protein
MLNAGKRGCIMADQYVEAAGEERFDAAVELTLEQWSESQSLPFEQVAAEAVHEVFCRCITQTYTEEEMARHLSSLDKGIIAEVVRRAQIRLNNPG